MAEPAPVAEERPSSPRIVQGPDPAVERFFLVHNATSEQQAIDTAALEAGNTYRGLSISNIRATPREGHPDELIWDVQIEYGFNGPLAIGQEITRFEIGTQRVRVQEALETTIYYDESIDPPSHGTRINVRDGEVQGADVDVPTWGFVVSKAIADADFTLAYQANAYAITGAVNNAAFRGFPAESLMFKGITGTQRRGDSAVEVSFRFEFQPNFTGEVADSTGVEKKGWDIVDIYYREKAENAASAVIQEPWYVAVHKVARSASFAVLGLSA